MKPPEGWGSIALALKVGGLEVGDSGPLSTLGEGMNGVLGGPEGSEKLGAEVETWFPALSLTLNHYEICLSAVGAVGSGPSETL